MKSLSAELESILALIQKEGITSVSLDIDGTIYPMKNAEWNWWKAFFFHPKNALKFLKIRKEWEKRRMGEDLATLNLHDVEFFEIFLGSLLTPSMIPQEIHTFLAKLQNQDMKIYFLSDHGAEIKLNKLGIHLGTGINCLRESGELKPHAKISSLLREKYDITPSSHLHLGDRWTDEAQAKILGSHFRFLKP